MSWSRCPYSYALADNVYHSMLAEFNNHFILISGESGSGKTEASKKILQYYAVSCPSTTLLNTVRDKILMSNPVLEVHLLHYVNIIRDVMSYHMMSYQMMLCHIT